MSFFYFEVKRIKIKNAPIYFCPNPQYNERCQGKYIKTRRWQTECVECMKVHKTIHKHPLLEFIARPFMRPEPTRYDDWDEI